MPARRVEVPFDLFRAELEVNGAYIPPKLIISDSKLHHYPVEDKPRGKDGAYVLRLDTITR